jgi:hypothetical protein
MLGGVPRRLPIGLTAPDPTGRSPVCGPTPEDDKILVAAFGSGGKARVPSGRIRVRCEMRRIAEQVSDSTRLGAALL